MHFDQLFASKANVAGSGAPFASRPGTGGSWQKSPESTSWYIRRHDNRHINIRDKYLNTTEWLAISAQNPSDEFLQ